MRIAFLTPEHITESIFDGGLANYIFRVARGLKKQGHEVEIFTCSDRDEDIFHHQILVHRIEAKKSFFFNTVNRLTGYRYQKTLSTLLVSYYLRKSLLNRFRRYNFDIIQPSSFLACGLLLTFGRPAPIVTRVSSYAPLWRKFNKRKLDHNQRIAERLELTALRRSNSVYAPSRLLASIIEKS